MDTHYSMTREFTEGSVDAGDLSTKVDLNDYGEVCSKSLKEIRKETDNGMKTKRKKKAQSKAETKPVPPESVIIEPAGESVLIDPAEKSEVADERGTMSNDAVEKEAARENIVESAIGKSTDETLDALEKLKAKTPKKEKGNSSNGKAESRSDKAEKSLFDDIPDRVQAKDTVQNEPAVMNARTSEQFTGTSMFEKDTEPAQKSETKEESSGGIDIIEFLHKVSTLTQLRQFSDVLLRFDFYISHTENNGAALYSELIECLDRITSNSKSLLDFVCANFEVYNKSLVDITALCITHCEKDPVNTELAETLRQLKRCMR